MPTNSIPAIATKTDALPVLRKEAAFIDTNVDQYQTLVAGVRPGVEVVLLDGSRDGLAQMAEWAHTHSGYDAIHVLSHGFEGGIFLGSSRVNVDTLDGNTASLMTIGASLNSGGDILLYGCDVSKGAGQPFAGRLAALTGADVATSTNGTGAAALGGDWHLEQHTGAIEAATVLTVPGQQDWNGLLIATTLAAGDIAILGLNADDTAGSQRWAFVAMRDIGAGTVIHFTDASYDGSISAASNRFYTSGNNEGFMTWTVGADITAGTLFIVTNNGSGNASMTDKDLNAVTGLSGSLGTSTNTAFLGTGDQIFAYQGTSGTTVGATFIYGINTGQNGTNYTNGSWISTGSITGQQFSYIPDGLTNGTSAIALTSNSLTGSSSASGTFGFDNMKYNGITTGNKADLLAAVGNATNWVGDNTTPYVHAGIGNFTINGAPTVTGITSSTANGSYKVGATVDITLTFSEAVTVNSAGGTPQLTLETGATDRPASYVSGSGTTVLHFTYTVAAGDTSADLDYASNTALALNGGTIQAVAGGANAVLTLPAPGAAGSLGANKAIVIDTTSPAAPSVPDLQAASDSGLNTDNITNATTPTFTGTAEAGSSVTLYANGSTVLGTATATGGNWSITANSALVQGTHTISAQATDAAGNVGAMSGNLSVTIDTAAPTGLGLSSTSVAVTSTGSNAAIATISATDNQAITYALATGNGTIDANNGSFNISGTDLRTSSALSAGTYKIYLSATDVAGNVSYSAQTITVASGPTLTDANISISGASGTGGAYKAGDTVTATWDNTAAGDNASGVTGVTVDFSAFGGGSAVTAVNSSGTWTASYTIAAGSIDATNRNVSVTATNGNGPTTTADTTNATVDNMAPAVTASNIGLSGATGSGGTYKVGDTVTATWNNTAAGDNNSDTLSGVTVDFSAFGGGSAVAATNSGGVWTAAYLIAAGSTDATGANVTVTATDNAGNATSRAGTANATVDTQAPVVTDANLSISGGTGGVFKAGDTVTATWNNTAAGDNNTDTLSSVTFDFSAFGGGTAVAASNTAGVWSATYTITAGALSAGNRNISATVTDNAGNTTTRADTSNATVDNSVPAVTGVTSSTVNGAYKAGATVSIQVAFGENVTVTGTPTLALNNGASAVYTAGSGSGTLTFTYTIAAGQNSADLDYASTTALTLAGGSIRDAAGNDAVLTLPAPGAAGSLGANKNIVVDTTAPTAQIASLAFSNDTGGSNTDLVANSGTQTLNGTLNSIFALNERVEVSLNNGTTWVDATAAEGGLAWSLSGQTLSGSGTLKVRVSDAAGNHGPELSRAYTIDSTAPTFNPASGTPADNAASAATSGAIVLPFSEALDATPVTGSVLTSVQLRDVATNTVVPATVTINGSGQLVITPTAALANSTAYYVNWGANALKDLAGNSVAAVADQTTYNFTTAAAPSDGGGSTPPPGQSTVDGTTVQTGTTTNSNGTTTTTTTVAPVPATRPEDPNTPNSQLADIPLATSGGETVLQIGLPVGVGVTSSETTGNNLTLREKLMGASQPISLPADFTQLLQAGIDTYVPGVQDQSQVTVRTLTLTSGTGNPPGQPIVITGANGTGESDTAHPARQEALVIDARSMPSGTVLQFDKVEFAIVIGAVRVVGGEGANFVVGDSAAQFIVLGPDDDVLRGGGGDDVIGSHGGNDKLYGDDGNDTLVGGVGNDQLEGGAGNDVLIGGAADAGTWQFALGSDGRLHASYNAKEAALSDLVQGSIVGNWQGGDAIDPRLALVYNQDYGRLETTALLFQGLTGQLPTLDLQNVLSTPEWTKANLLQSAWNWYQSTLPANLGTADKAKALITQTVGASMATAQNVQIAVDYLAQGGTWTGALDFLIHLPQVKNAITTQTSTGSLLNLIQAGTIAETGWSFDSGNDTLLGGAGNDVLIGGGGNDLLDGGEGTDMAVYVGQVQHYSFKLQTNASTGQAEVLVRMLASGEVDTLRSVELLQVGGQTYRIDTAGLQQGVDYTLAGHVQLVGAAELALAVLPAF
jgi:Ca2+-binding RTX toxin-like protein